jgi:hypothetical protein
MSRMQFRIWAVVLAVGSLLGLPSCGLPQQLDGISIQPATATFGSPSTALSVQLTAYGYYVHPSATKDVTSQVVWTTDVTGLVTVTSGGLVTPTGTACGIVNVTGSITNSPHTPKGQVYAGHATITIDDTSNTSCPQPQ